MLGESSAAVQIIKQSYIIYRTIKNYLKQLTILAWPTDHTFHTTSGLCFEFRQHFAKPRATENATSSNDVLPNNTTLSLRFSLVFPIKNEHFRLKCFAFPKLKTPILIPMYSWSDAIALKSRYAERTVQISEFLDRSALIRFNQGQR